MTDFRDMATANQSCWMWQLDMDGVAGELEGAIGSFFGQGVMQQKQRQQNNSQTCSARYQAVVQPASGGGGEGWQELELGRI